MNSVIIAKNGFSIIRPFLYSTLQPLFCFVNWVLYQILMISLHCHPERSEASLCPSRQTLRCAQGDTRVSDTTGLRGQLAITQRYSNQSDWVLFDGLVVLAQ